jgi:hypothetical protein
MSEYLLLIFNDEAAAASAAPAVGTAMLEEHVKFQQKHADALRGGNALQPTATATTIRSGSDGGSTVTDGAFAETKEALGGYYLVEAADLDQALAIAKDVPRDDGGAVEVRPIRVFS